MSTRAIVASLSVTLAACASASVEDQLARQAYYGLTPASYGTLRDGPGDRYCRYSEALIRNARPSRSQRGNREAQADETIAAEQLQHHFANLVGSTMHQGWLSGGAVVAIIDRTPNRVVFWRVVTETPYTSVEAAAAQYCETRGLRSRTAGQSFSCSQVYQPIRGQPIQGQNIDVRMQQTYAISAFNCR